MRRSEKKNIILEAARFVFSKYGYHKTSVADIIKNAGIARGTFYLYFTNKRAVFDKLLDELIIQLSIHIEHLNISKIDVESDVYQHIKKLARILIQTIDDNKDLAKILLTSPMSRERDFERKVNQFYETIAVTLQKVLSDGVNTGRLRKLNVKLVPYLYIGSLKEIMYQYIVMDKFQDDMDMVIDEVSQFMLNATLPKDKIQD